MTPDEAKAKLLSLGQQHLLEGLSAGEEKALLEQTAGLHAQLPGGLDAYVASARRLLKNSAEGVNPFAGFNPTVPDGKILVADSPEFELMERAGCEQVKHAGFILVAGGLGERLGYDGIKISLPLYESERTRSFMQLYCDHILTMQRQSGATQLPLAIMTSDDTHALTEKLFSDNNNFGMAPGQITIMKQNKVPALKDSNASFAGKGGVIETKPHGHGDVHTLMHQTGTAQKWLDNGVRWIIFFQDTNGIIFRALSAVLGVSASNKFDVNSVCVPRTPGEAVGGICRLEHLDGRVYTVNVEYNQLDPLLRSTAAFSSGDVADPATGNSPFPGNINCLVFGCDRYVKVLKATNGVVSEFVNPKYADDTKTAFKSATRLECMMQDFPMLLPPEAPVGFTQLDRWLCFSPVKNNIQDASAKAAKNLPPECAGTAERDALILNANLLRFAGASVPQDGHSGTYAGVPLTFPPLIMLLPSFATCLTHVKAHCGKGADLRVSARSALTLDGDVDIEGVVELDGALVVRAAPGAKIVIKKLKVHNDGWCIEASSKAEEAHDEMLRMRGYKVVKRGTREIFFDGPGTKVVDE